MLKHFKTFTLAVMLLSYKYFALVDRIICHLDCNLQGSVSSDKLMCCLIGTSEYESETDGNAKVYRLFGRINKY